MGIILGFLTILGIVIVVTALVIGSKGSDLNHMSLFYLGGHPDLKGPKNVSVRNKGMVLEIDHLVILKADVIDVRFIPPVTGEEAAARDEYLTLKLGRFQNRIKSGFYPKRLERRQLLQLIINREGKTFELFFTGLNIIRKRSLLQKMIFHNKKGDLFSIE